MKKKVILLFGLLIICTLFTACNPSIELIGKWKIVELETGKVDMDEQDVQSMGGLDLGYIKINKSGSCKVNFLGDEYDGSWSGVDLKKVDSNTRLELNYGDGLTATATFKGDKMLIEDSQGAEYKLEK